MDDYRKLSREWGSKARKDESRASKSTLRNIPEDELEPEVESDSNVLPKPYKKTKKDTKRWCGGKEGREHKGECLDYDAYKNPQYKSILSKHGKSWIFVCKRCRKHLDYWCNRWGRNRPKPAWLKE